MSNDPAHHRIWMKKLRDEEERCLSYLRPFNVTELDPVLRQVHAGTHLSFAFDYYRLMVSSSAQKVSIGGIGRSSRWMWFDKSSGSVLGLCFFAGLSSSSRVLDRYVGAKITKPMHFQQMLRCLPIFEFGQLTGGKLMTLGVTSTEFVKTLELRYSIPIVFFTTKALHGKSSQYNRLHARGIILNKDLSVDEKAVYSMPLRQNWREVLSGQAEDGGEYLTYSFHDQVTYWRERWLPNRMDRTDHGIVKPDIERYRLSTVFQQKLEETL